jgi:glycosyltransferase involved in cell wall biosynthesis
MAPRPTLESLPAPPRGKTGWPWTEETPQLGERDAASLPTISVVTPSYNQGAYLEETIRSVLLQGYPKLEYIVFDGGSTDDSGEILRKYAPWLAHYEIEKDRGQAHAINKGLDRATGDVAAYLNSDDYYLPGALQHVARVWTTPGFDVFVGRQRRIGEPPRRKLSWPLLRRSWWLSRYRPFVYPFVATRQWAYEIPQECTFWNHRRYGSSRLDESFRFCLDAEWFVRIYSGARIVHSEQRIGVFRIHPESKTTQLQAVWRAELDRILAVYGPAMDGVSARDVRSVARRFRAAKVRAALRRAVGQNPSLFCYTHPAYLKDATGR